MRFGIILLLFLTFSSFDLFAQQVYPSKSALIYYVLDDAYKKKSDELAKLEESLDVLKKKTLASNNRGVCHNNDFKEDSRISEINCIRAKLIDYDLRDIEQANIDIATIIAAKAKLDEFNKNCENQSLSVGIPGSVAATAFWGWRFQNSFRTRNIIRDQLISNGVSKNIARKVSVSSVKFIRGRIARTATVFVVTSSSSLVAIRYMDSNSKEFCENLTEIPDYPRLGAVTSDYSDFILVADISDILDAILLELDSSLNPSILYGLASDLNRAHGHSVENSKKYSKSLQIFRGYIWSGIIGLFAVFIYLALIYFGIFRYRR